MKNLFYSYLILALLFKSSSIAKAEDSLYLSGQQVCNNTITQRSLEKGDYVAVPLTNTQTESNPNLTQQTTSIYYWTLEEFRPEYPSMIYFVGGPGGSAHQFQINLPNWNIIYFDQRGTACSQFSTLEQALNGSLYSSEMIARDAEYIRQHLGIQQWSVYGHSYGTVPATIYAHLFPTATKALVLEGTVSSGTSDLWNAPRRLKILQSFYDHLPNDLKKVVQTISAGVSNELTFSQIAFSFFYLDDSLKLILNYLNDMKVALLPSPANSEAKLDLPGTALENLGSSPNNYTAITCRELSGMKGDSNFYYQFINEKFTINRSISDQEARQQKCQTFGVTAESSLVKTYQAADYSVNVPTTYFQGTTDGATTANQAVHHYKKAAQGPKQILIKINGGHTPNIGLISKNLTDSAPEEPGPNSELIKTTQQKIFTLALTAQPIPQSLLESVNQLSDLKWVKTQKNFNETHP